MVKAHFQKASGYICSISETGKNIKKAATLLRNGELVAIPTETVYGLAANALNEKAVLSVFEVKQRPFFDPLIIHVDSSAAAEKYAVFSDERLKKLADRFWPGPLTLLLPKKNNVPDIVTSGLPQVAVRVPDHPLTLELLRSIQLPLAAPSANPFGYVSPTEPAHVEKQLGSRIPYILDGGECKVGIESTIVGVEEGVLCVYRLGGLEIEAIEGVAGRAEIRINNSSDPKAPGQLKSHYAPKTPVFLGNVEHHITQNPDKKIGILCFGEEKISGSNIVTFNLSESASIKEAAINLFRLLRKADESDIDLLIALPVPEEGLGKAINDRLRRAAG